MRQPALYLRLLGGFAVASDAGFASTLRVSSKKACALLACVAMNPGQAASREQIAALLWEGSSERHARQSLRQTLVHLRRDLGDLFALEADTQTIRLPPGAVWVDALALQDMAAASDSDTLKRAVALVRGEFLAGLSLDVESFEDWVRRQRQRLEMASAVVLERYAGQCDALGHGEDAVAAAEKLHDLDPLREDWQRLALDLYLRHRGPHQAAARAKVFTDEIRRELAVEPEPKTRVLIEQIQRAVALAATPARATPPKAAPAVSVVEQLELPPPAAVAPTDVAKPTVVAAPTAVAWSAPKPSGPWWRRPRFAAGLATAAVTLIAGVWVFASHNTPSLRELAARWAAVNPAAGDPWRSPVPPSRRAAEPVATRGIVIPIAVLPFQTYGDATAATRLVADMITDDLMNVLSRVPDLRVISRGTLRSYNGQAIDVAKIGAELQVRYVLEGSLRMVGNRLNVNVELIDATTRLAVWSDRFERDDADRYGMHEDIVRRLGRELQFEIYPIEAERRSVDRDADTLAYRGWAAMHAAFSKMTVEAYEKAGTLFRDALARDPNNLAALMGLGAYHANLGVQRHDLDSGKHIALAREILEEVVRRSPNNGVAYHHLGIVLQGSGHLPEALTMFERAVAYNPSNASAHAHIGHALARMGRPAEGLEHIRYAMRLSPKDPASAIWFEFSGNAQLELGWYTDAVASFQQASELSPTYPRPWAGLAAAHALAGHPAEARANMEKLKALFPMLTEMELVDRFGRYRTARLRAGLTIVAAPSPMPATSPPPVRQHTEIQPPVWTVDADGNAMPPVVDLSGAAGGTHGPLPHN